MKRIVDNIVKKNIHELLMNDDIISIFLVGSMASDNYIEKKYNDYDIRFIVKDINVEIYSQITRVLDNIRKEIENNDINCEVSDIIGPVKMNGSLKRNILIHGITMTPKDLDELPNIHKYSYSSNYQIIDGEDLIEKYKNIVIKPSDIVNSVEGIEFCINLIKNRKSSCSRWEKIDNKLYLNREYYDIANEDMIELFIYSYKKSLSNIQNMIKTNNIKTNIDIDFSDEEIKLINKIDSNILNANDIDESINIMISILYKLEKTCIEIYAKKREYHNSLEWGIIKENTSSIRGNGFEFLKRIKLPTGNNFSIKNTDILVNKDKYNEEISKSNYLVIFEPHNNSYQRCGIFGVNSFDQIEEYIRNNNININNYQISLVEIIEKITHSFAGVLMSDGEGNTIIEIINDTVDSRELTSCGADAKRIMHFESNDFDNTLYEAPKVIREIKEICQYFRGYYEFAYGSIRGVKDIYFTFYSSNDEYINIFKGGKKYGKAL